MATLNADIKSVDQAVGASFVAAGIGSLVLGLMVILVDASAKINSALVLVKPVGALSGKTAIAVAAFILSWVIAHFAFRGRDVNLNRIFTISIVMVGIGFLFTFPPAFELVADALKPLFGG